MDRLIAKLFRAPAELTKVQLSGWQRLPGGRLEFGDTGFAIHLNNKATDAPYRLFDPEGRPLANGYLLQPLKEYGEQMARDRAEFGR